MLVLGTQSLVVLLVASYGTNVISYIDILHHAQIQLRVNHTFVFQGKYYESALIIYIEKYIIDNINYKESKYHELTIFFR